MVNVSGSNDGGGRDLHWGVNDMVVVGAYGSVLISKHRIPTNNNNCST